MIIQSEDIVALETEDGIFHPKCAPNKGIIRVWTWEDLNSEYYGETVVCDCEECLEDSVIIKH